MPMYNLKEYNDNYSKTAESLWQYYRDESSSNDNDDINNFPDNIALFKSKQKITGETGDNAAKDVKLMVPLIYLSNFWRTLEIPLINWKVNLILTWSANCIIPNVAENQATTYKTDPKLYVPIVTLPIQDNAKLLQQLKSSFKKTISWNKY